MEKLHNKSQRELKINWYKTFYGIALFSCLLFFDWDEIRQKDEKFLNNSIELNLWNNKLDNVIQSNELVCWLSSIELIVDSLIKSGNYNKAVDLLLQEKDSLLQNNIVWCEKAFRNIYSSLWLSYLALEKYDIGFEYYEKAYNLAENLSDDRKKILNLNDIAYWYIKLKQHEKSIIYLNEAYSILEKTDISSPDIAYTAYLIYTNLSNYYVNQKDYDKAKIFFEKFKKLVFSDVGFWEETKVVVLSWEADFLIAEKKYKEAIKIYEEALFLAQKIGHLEYQEWLLNEIKSIYINQYWDYKLAYEFLEKFSEVRDSRINIEFQKSIAAKQEEYWTKELEYKNEKQQAELEIQKQNNIKRTVFWVSVSLIALLAWAFYVNSRRKNAQLREKNEIITEQKAEVEKQKVVVDQKNQDLDKKNQDLEKANKEIMEQKAELDTAYEELRATNENLTETNDKLERANNDINSSINYASRIQASILYNDIQEHFPKSFVFYKPKDVVSWDFYFSAENSKGKKIIAVADCTGHGVPGALLTILGKTDIQQIFDKVDGPNQIIDHLDNQFLDLQKKSKFKDHMMHDSMDIACIFYDTKTKILDFSSAFRPIFIFRKNWNIEKIESTTRAELWSQTKKSDFDGYKNLEIQLYSGDEVFLFTDWLSDQFDKHDRKLKLVGFRDILSLTTTIPMAERTSYIQKMYENMMKKPNGELVSQTDDMCLVGFRVE